MEQAFEVAVIRLCCVQSIDANLLRGGFGKALRGIDRGAYDRMFEPKLIEGPSGLRDAPLPFVLRVREGGFGFHLFDPRESVDTIVRAFQQFVPIQQVELDRLKLPFASERDAERIRIHFKTPIELKGADQPEFGVLFARVRDRISTLRALYQGGPLELDFKAIGDRAAQIKMTRCKIEHVDAQRTSRRTGQTHSLGGFVGVAEYEGALGEFLPYLEIAKWTGVGRQTVWGKGEIDCETF